LEGKTRLLGLCSLSRLASNRLGHFLVSSPAIPLSSLGEYLYTSSTRIRSRHCSTPLQFSFTTPLPHRPLPAAASNAQHRQHHSLLLLAPPATKNASDESLRCQTLTTKMTPSKNPSHASFSSQRALRRHPKHQEKL
jgi:hypothetical protein